MSDQGGHRAGRRVVAAGIDGNVMEWYDFSVYGFFARTIGNISPRRIRAPLCSLAFGVFAVGFLMRPLGAVLFGHIGDRVAAALLAWIPETRRRLKLLDIATGCTTWP